MVLNPIPAPISSSLTCSKAVVTVIADWFACILDGYHSLMSFLHLRYFTELRLICSIAVVLQFTNTALLIPVS